MTCEFHTVQENRTTYWVCVATVKGPRGPRSAQAKRYNIWEALKIAVYDLQEAGWIKKHYT